MLATFSYLHVWLYFVKGEMGVCRRFLVFFAFFCFLNCFEFKLYSSFEILSFFSELWIDILINLALWKIKEHKSLLFSLFREEP